MAIVPHKQNITIYRMNLIYLCSEIIKKNMSLLQRILAASIKIIQRNSNKSKSKLHKNTGIKCR